MLLLLLFNCGRQEEPALLISRLLLRKPAFVWTSTERNLITRVLTICQVKLMQSTALEQKRFDLQSLSPVLRKLWLLLVLAIITIGSCLISGMLWPGLLSSLSPTLYPAFPLFYKREKNAFNTSTRVRYGVYIVFTYVYKYEKPRTLA